MQIRRTLKEYRDALTLSSELLSLQPPSHQTPTALSKNFHNYSSTSGSKTDGPRFPTLSGASEVSSHSIPHDRKPTTRSSCPCPSLHPRPAHDIPHQLLRTALRLRRRPPSSNASSSRPSMVHASRPHHNYTALRHVTLTAPITTVLLSAILLIAPIVALSYVPNPGRQRGTTMGPHRAVHGVICRHGQAGDERAKGGGLRGRSRLCGCSSGVCGRKQLVLRGMSMWWVVVEHCEATRRPGFGQASMTVFVCTSSS